MSNTMSNEAATLNAGAWQNVMSMLANLCGWLRARPHQQQATPYEQAVGPLLDAWQDEAEQVRRFVESQMERGFWI